MRSHVPAAPPKPRPQYLIYGDRDTNSLAFTDDLGQTDRIAEEWSLKHPGKTVWVTQVLSSVRHIIHPCLRPDQGEQC